MKAKVAKRTRIARVRRIQHDLAAADAARAENHAAMLENSAERLMQLRQSLVARHGRSDGATLANLGELAMRLDAAREGLSDAIASARASAEYQAGIRLEARRRQESADRLESRAADALAQFLERNTNITPRRRIGGLIGGKP